MPIPPRSAPSPARPPRPSLRPAPPALSPFLSPLSLPATPSSTPAGMTHVSPYSASAKGFTYPDHSLESRRPKRAPSFPLFEPLTAPPDEEKGRKFRSPESTSSLSLGFSLGTVGGVGAVVDEDGAVADEWLGLGSGAGVEGGRRGLFEAPVLKELVQTRSRFSPEEEWAWRINKMVFDPSETSLEIRYAHSLGYPHLTAYTHIRGLISA